MAEAGSAEPQLGGTCVYWRPEVALTCLREKGEVSGTGLLSIGVAGNLGTVGC